MLEIITAFLVGIFFVLALAAFTLRYVRKMKNRWAVPLCGAVFFAPFVYLLSQGSSDCKVPATEGDNGCRFFSFMHDLLSTFLWIGVISLTLIIALQMKLQWDELK